MKSIEEIHQKYMHALTAIEEENLNCRSQYHKLCSEYAFVKSEFENREMEMANQLHEMKVKCEKEVCYLCKEKF